MIIAVDVFEAMVKQEEVYKTVDYLQPAHQAKLEAAACDFPDLPSTSSSSSGVGISPAWRERICEWIYQVVDHFDFSRETVAISMHMLDRYLSVKQVNKQVFQLAAMTCLYLSIKLNEAGRISMPSMIELSRGFFTVQQMKDMEMSILRALRWNVHPPTACTFIAYILGLVPNSTLSPDLRHHLSELARFLSELSVMDYFFVPHKASHIAIASVLNSLEEYQIYVPIKTQLEVMKSFEAIGINSEDPGVLECRRRLRLLYTQGGYARPSDRESPVAVENFDRAMA